MASGVGIRRDNSSCSSARYRERVPEDPRRQRPAGKLTRAEVRGRPVIVTAIVPIGDAWLCGTLRFHAGLLRGHNGDVERSDLVCQQRTTSYV